MAFFVVALLEVIEVMMLSVASFVGGLCLHSQPGQQMRHGCIDGKGAHVLDDGLASGNCSARNGLGLVTRCLEDITKRGNQESLRFDFPCQGSDRF